MNSLCYTIVGFDGGHNMITFVEECDVYFLKINDIFHYQTQSPYNVSCIQQFGHNETF
jgi:hypothetical protein